ncbi:unnamed protein product [Clonostachys chloroleuca]|uniref:Tail specific protease domain-containing protein n=1 Tax=Clonostachys chloroleuca TaxID=1926264 RepID=A0AA35VC07_9HYPO|nr:unnamed protein product [Clonostachys chloroleuca]
MRCGQFLSGLAAIANVFLQGVAAQSTTKGPCQLLAEYQSSVIAQSQSPYPGDIQFIKLDAEMAYNCSASVPLVPEDALGTIDYLKNYSNFDTTLSFLKKPPPSYQKPGVDIMGRLDRVADNVRNGKYSSYAEFESDVWVITSESSEGHFSISLQLLGLFSYILNDTIVSLSRDGKELPQIYARSDIESLMSNPSPIIELGGKPVFEYLRSYIERNTKSGFIEPHADWNAMVYNGPYVFASFGVDVQQSWAFRGFQQTKIYNGKSLQVRFANGSDVEWVYNAGSRTNLLANNLTSPGNIYYGIIASPGISSGINTRSDELINRDRLEPVALGERQQQNTPRPKPFHSVPLFNYPRNPDVLEVNFGVGGIVSGYILQDDSIGVLSLPSYNPGESGTGTTALNYTNAVIEFITKAKESRVKKIVIDLSGNGGGAVFLGYTIFKLFFPSIKPSLLGRVRATPHINTIGSILTGVLQDRALPSDNLQFIYETYGGRIGLSAYDILDLDDREFESWSAFFGPRENNDDSFTNGARYNLSSSLMETENYLDFAIPGYGSDVIWPQSELWAAEDIILLHDGLCASTCAIFSELMKTDAGVKSVAVGGIPQYGPMQGVSGTRGSSLLKFEFYSGLMDDINKILRDLGNQASASLRRWGVPLDDVQALPLPISNSPLRIEGSGVNALDMIRVSSPDAPLQFTYQASDCRLFHTFDTAHDIRVLWRTAAKVAGGDMSACVPGSINAPGSSSNVTLLSDPGYSYNSAWERANSTDVPKNKGVNGSGSVAPQLSVGLAGLLAVALAFVLAF